jgi:hypothetical protein
MEKQSFRYRALPFSLGQKPGPARDPKEHSSLSALQDFERCRKHRLALRRLAPGWQNSGL